MAITTVNSAFDELLKRIELNPSRIQMATTRYQSVKSTLEAGISGCEVFQIGSFQRKTKIRPIDENEGLDIDVGVCLGSYTEFAQPPEQGTNPLQALTRIKRALEQDKTYRMMDPEKDAPTVTLEYEDGLKIEIVPCYRSIGRHYSRGKAPFCYIVGKDSNSWQPADYDYDAEVISGLNQIKQVQESLVPSIKMIKRFLQNYQSPLNSIHVEVLCASIIPSAIIYWENQRQPWHYQHVLSNFLTQAHTKLDGPVKHPGSYSIPVDSGLDILLMLQLGSSLKKLGDYAWSLCNSSDSMQTIEKWGEFYKQPFPVL